MTRYSVQPGDCVSSIAFRFGFTSDALWNHRENADLKRRRRTPALLLPGDELFIPDKRVTAATVQTGKAHTFVLTLPRTLLRLRLVKAGKVRSNEAYEIAIEDERLTGTTDGDGRIEREIPADATECRLTLKSTGESYRLLLGHLDPADSITGVQGRLRSLGYYGGEITGALDAPTRAALASFQRAQKLADSGDADEQTTSALRKAHGS